MTETRITNPDTGGQKGQKLERFDLLPWPELTELARVYGKGAAKYADRNWEKGYNASLSYASAMRHLTQWWNGEDNDPEIGESHLMLAAFHLFGMRRFQRMDEANGTTLVDRPAPVQRTVTSTPEGYAAFAERWLTGTKETRIDEAPKYGNVPTLDEQIKAFVGRESTLGIKFGVGDWVEIYSQSTGHGGRYLRRFDGTWGFQGTARSGTYTKEDYPAGKDTVFRDADILEIVETGRWSYAPAAQYEIAEMAIQRRPWRQGSTDTWVAGDKITFAVAVGCDVDDRGVTWERTLDGRWKPLHRGPIIRAVASHTDAVMTRSIRFAIKSDHRFELELVGVSHDAEQVRILGG